MRDNWGSLWSETPVKRQKRRSLVGIKCNSFTNSLLHFRFSWMLSLLYTKDGSMLGVGEDDVQERRVYQFKKERKQRKREREMNKEWEGHFCVASGDLLCVCCLLWKSASLRAFQTHQYPGVQEEQNSYSHIIYDSLNKKQTLIFSSLLVLQALWVLQRKSLERGMHYASLISFDLKINQSNWQKLQETFFRPHACLCFSCKKTRISLSLPNAFSHFLVTSDWPKKKMRNFPLF